jgi:DNA-binding transcriptional regulator YhcF (GntR family)
MNRHFVKIPNEVLFDMKEKVAFAYLARKVFTFNGQSTKKLAEVALQCGISARDITNANDDLKGLIEVTEQHNPENGYRIPDKVVFKEIEGFYTQVDAAIIKDANTSYKARVLFIKIQKITNKETNFYGVKSFRKMAEKFNTTMSSLMRSLDELEENGYVEVNENEVIINEVSNWGQKKIVAANNDSTEHLSDSSNNNYIQSKYLNIPQVTTSNIRETKQENAKIEVEVISTETVESDKQIENETLNDNTFEDPYSDEEFKTERNFLWNKMNLDLKKSTNYDVENEMDDIFGEASYKVEKEVVGKGVNKYATGKFSKFDEELKMASFVLNKGRR